MAAAPERAPTARPAIAETSLTRRSALQLTALLAVGLVVAPSRAASAAALPARVAAPAAGASAYRPTFLRFAYAGDASVTGTERWQWQGLQGNLRRPTRGQVARQLVYATVVQRPSDPAGITQCLRPADVRPEWLLRDTQGRVINRPLNGAGGDNALDVGHPDLRAAAAAFLVAKCRTEGWTGVLLDEVNAAFGWGFPGRTPARYPTAAAYRTAMIGFVRTVTSALRAAGFEVAGNLGTVVPDSGEFCRELVGAGMVPVSEFFVAGSSDSAPASLENGGWDEQVRWAEWSLATAAQTLLHDKQTAAEAVRYGLATFLLVDNGTGAYGASVEYTAEATASDRSGASQRCFDDALALGAPQGPRREVQRGVWRRDFDNGWVLVNTSESPCVAAGQRLAGTSALISLGAGAPALGGALPTVPAVPAPTPTPLPPGDWVEWLLRWLRILFPSLPW